MSVEKLKRLIDESTNIVFFGGAGTSTESNIPDFRSDKGLAQKKRFNDYPLERILSHSFFIEHPEEFFRFYKENMIFLDAIPNKAHHALVALEKEGKLKSVITQNVDGLHQMAGSKKVLELHGSVHRNYCLKCDREFTLAQIMQQEELIPKCHVCNGLVRPDVVLYEEALQPEIIEQALQHISNADMLIVGGTSLVVYPAAGMINYYRGNKLVLVNKDATAYDSKANLVINDSIGKVLAEATK